MNQGSYNGAADDIRIQRDAKRDRSDRRRTERDKSNVLSTERGLRDLKKAINPTMFIPYNTLLSEDGYLGYYMSRKIHARKTEIMNEMSKIMEVEEKYKEEFGKYDENTK